MMKTTQIAQFFILIFFNLAPIVSSAQSSDVDDFFLPVSEAFIPTFVFNQETISLNWEIADEYYLYRDKFQFTQIGSDSEIALSPEYEEGERKFDKYFNKELEIYFGSTAVQFNKIGLPSQFTLKVRSQGCAEAGLCYAPRTQYFRLNLTEGFADEIPKEAINAEFLAQTEQESINQDSGDSALHKPLWLFILSAFAGGLLLNFMPCVFPILSLKALDFSHRAKDGTSGVAQGWAYTVGVLGSFLVMGFIIVSMRAAGEAADWGSQFHSPIFVAFMAYLFLLLGLSLSGVVHFNTNFSGLNQRLSDKKGLVGSVSTGILATLVSSPCTGPLMAPAIGFGLLQSSGIALLIFLSLGLGFALPFLLLSYSPRLANALPRPGKWMSTLKEFLAFPLYISSAWMLYVFSRQVNATGAFFLVIGGIALIFAVWVFHHQPRSATGKVIARSGAITAILFALYVGVAGDNFKDQPEGRMAYSRELVETLRKQGRPVFVEVTADWCITCKANELNALSRKEFKNFIKMHNYAILRGDYTNEDPNITEVLRDFNRAGVPLYLVYPADPEAPVEILPQIITQDIVLDALQRGLDASKIASHN